jgi:HSP20 family protein
VRETREAFVCQVDLPGVVPRDVEVSLDGHELTISGRRDPERRRVGERYAARERAYGRFSRSFVLPADLDPDRVDAELDQGVLTVRIPRQRVVRRSLLRHVGRLVGRVRGA